MESITFWQTSSCRPGSGICFTQATAARGIAIEPDGQHLHQRSRFHVPDVNMAASGVVREGFRPSQRRWEIGLRPLAGHEIQRRCRRKPSGICAARAAAAAGAVCAHLPNISSANSSLTRILDLREEDEGMLGIDLRHGFRHGPPCAFCREPSWSAAHLSTAASSASAHPTRTCMTLKSWPSPGASGILQSRFVIQFAPAAE